MIWAKHSNQITQSQSTCSGKRSPIHFFILRVKHNMCDKLKEVINEHKRQNHQAS